MNLSIDNLLRCGTCAALAGLAACASPGPERPADAEALAGVVEARPGRRGNPPFYDVFGQRYYVLASSAGYRETGLASWYGEDFHGLPTAGGEIYDMHAMTAAHKSLPIPTWVEVRHLGNDKRVIVKVNDRGPFVDGRIIDLSYSAARALDMLRSGTARVEVRALGTPAASPAPILAANEPVPAASPAERSWSLVSEAVAATPTAQDRPLEQVFVQAGAFAERRNALQLLDRLEAQGYPDVFVVSDRGELHRVRIGPISDVRELERVTDRLRSIGIRDAHLIVDR